MARKQKIYWAAFNRDGKLWTDSVTGVPWIYARKKDCWVKDVRKVKITEVKP